MQDSHGEEACDETSCRSFKGVLGCFKASDADDWPALFADNPECKKSFAFVCAAHVPEGIGESFAGCKNGMNGVRACAAALGQKLRALLVDHKVCQRTYERSLLARAVMIEQQVIDEEAWLLEDLNRHPVASSLKAVDGPKAPVSKPLVVKKKPKKKVQKKKSQPDATALPQTAAYAYGYGPQAFIPAPQTAAPAGYPREAYHPARPQQFMAPQAMMQPYAAPVVQQPTVVQQPVVAAPQAAQPIIIQTGTAAPQTYQGALPKKRPHHKSMGEKIAGRVVNKVTNRVINSFSHMLPA